MGSERERMEVAAAAGWGNELWAGRGVFSAPTTSTASRGHTWFSAQNRKSAVPHGIRPVKNVNSFELFTGTTQGLFLPQTVN
jgi:hypothetical protein